MPKTGKQVYFWGSKTKNGPDCRIMLLCTRWTWRPFPWIGDGLTTKWKWPSFGCSLVSWNDEERRERPLPLDRRWIDHQMKMTVIWRHIGLVDWRGMTKKSNPNLRLEWRWNDQTTSEWHQMMSNDGPRCVRHSWQSAVVSSFHFFSVFLWITRNDRNCTRKTDWCGKKWTEVPYSKKNYSFFTFSLPSFPFI